MSINAKVKTVKTIKKNSEKVDRLFENFASELVTIILDKDLEISISTEEGIESHKTPLSASGYLTDVDDTYLYLGHMPNGINQAIRKEYIVHIEIGQLEEEELMEIGEIPKGVRGYN